MIISDTQLKAIMPNATDENRKQFVEYFNRHADRFGITTPMRAVGFLSQVAVESAELRATSENLKYSAKGLQRTFPRYFKTPELAAAYAYKPVQIANRVYANRMGNGSEASGDGWRYRGRGLIQLTGKNNYSAYQQSGYCTGNILQNPDLVAKYPGALKSAMWYWMKNGLNQLADTADVSAMTRRINGGTNGLDERKQYYDRARKALRC